jgi:hypothetical protein
MRPAFQDDYPVRKFPHLSTIDDTASILELRAKNCDRSSSVLDRKKGRRRHSPVLRHSMLFTDHDTLPMGISTPEN